MGRIEEIKKELEKLAIISKSKPPHQRTYKDRYDIWNGENFDNGEWDEGESIDIFDGKRLYFGEIVNLMDNKPFPDNIRKLGLWFGKKVKCTPLYIDQIFTLVGINYTYLDTYYIVEDSEGKREYISMVSGIELAEEKQPED